MSGMIQAFVQQGIKENPGAAAREVAEIVSHYITDNTRLNRVYQAACRVLIQPDKFNLELLRRAVAAAEGKSELWDERP